MVDPNSAKFISSLVKSLQMFCHGYMEFEDNIEIIGHINLRIDNRKKLDYIVNEQVSKQGQESTCFQSNSYHSVPPKSSERDPLHESVDSSMSVLSGTRVQVDLSGPSPVTRSTFASYADGFLSPLGSSQTYSQGRESQVETKQTLASGLKDTGSAAPVFNHSLIVNKETKRMGYVGVKDSGQADMNSSTPVSSDLNGQQQNLSGLLPGIVIKAEPGAFSSEKSGVSTSVSYSQPCTLPSLTFAQPVSFSASPAHLDTEHSEGGRQEGVLICTVGSSGSTPGLVPGDLSPSFSVAKQDLIILTQGRLPTPVQDPTLPADQSADKVEDSFPVLSSSLPSPVVKKQKLDRAQCAVCGTQFRNNRLLGMHMRLVHRKTPQQRTSLPHNHIQTPILSSSSTVIAFVETRNEENELAKSTDLQTATNSFLEMTDKSGNRAGSVAEVCEMSGQKDGDKPAPVACSFCQILFWNREDLGEHQKLCGQRYSTEEGCGEVQQSSCVCPSCHMVFLDAALLAQHRKACGGESTPTLTGPTTCPLCHLSFLDPALLSAHLWVCGKPAASTVELTACESGASSAGSGSSSSNVNSCDKCGKVFQGRTSLVDHINSMHKGMSFKCPDCGETFKWRTCVYRHRLRCCKGKNAAKQKKDNCKS
ncbi:uncharacterized protein LOC143293554 isoform X2 [Babylonia areolata]|uniref:uncharacterized protein LOC143293554 isoform X2 n=1 Tax=Babylonia areolata TaxID=304850 RepID=UPI003FCF04AD